MVDLMEDICAATGLSESMLFGTSIVLSPRQDREMHRYYCEINAMSKGLKRRNRQLRSRIERTISMARRRGSG